MTGRLGDGEPVHSSEVSSERKTALEGRLGDSEEGEEMMSDECLLVTEATGFSDWGNCLVTAAVCKTRDATAACGT